ncbi:MAG: Gfo/Idh/MocA family oxidoreductase [Candidatus Sumerlaeota bacterium]|nr:Gfo/Idh/MocA family oxidoreductase [Candidatus Sumerlaeota bacterium]
MADKVKLGFIGCGGIVKSHLKQGLGAFPDVEFVGWCDLRPEAAEERKAEVGGKGTVYTDAAKMLDEAKPDAVYIMLPPFAHGAAEDVVLERKLPFFVEKPVAIDMKTAQKVADAVKKNNLLTSVGYMTRYRQSVQKVRDLLKSQKPVLLHGGWLGAGPKTYDGIGKWWVQKDKSGGQFLEQTTHTIDLARCLFGDVESVFAVAVHGRKERPEFFTIEDASMVQLKFKNGAAGNLYSACCLGTAGGVMLTVFGTAMRASFTGWENTVAIQTAGGEKIDIKGEDNIFALEDRAFIDSVKAEKNVGILADYADGLKATEIACAANESMATGKVIQLA